MAILKIDDIIFNIEGITKSYLFDLSMTSKSTIAGNV